MLELRISTRSTHILMRIYSFFLLTLLFFNSSGSIGQQLSASQWIEDIDFLTSKMIKTIPEFESRVNQFEFNRRVENLKSNLSSYSESQIVFSLQQILSLVQDESCSIYPFQSSLNYAIIPIKSYWFKDGLLVCDASEEYKHLVNHKIIAVNGVQIDSVYAKLTSYISADNDSYKKYHFPYSINIPSLLSAANIGSDQNQIVLTLETEKVEMVTVKTVKEYSLLNRNLAGYKKLMSSSRKHSNEKYWMEYLPESNTLFLQFLQIRNNNEGMSFDSFIKEVKKRIASTEVEKLVIDCRYGGGGNGFKLKPFTDFIRESEKINQQGNLFVLTSRATRGSIMELTSILELNTKAIIIGEPTGEGPNTVGDNTSIELPNSKIKVSLTRTFWPTSWAIDNRKYIQPELVIDYSIEDYISNRDPWLEAVEGYKLTIENQKEIPKEVLSQITGDYIVVNRKLEINKMGTEVYMSMDRKMKSFFEIHTQLYNYSEGVLSTDISDVFINYTSDIAGKLYLTSIDWKGEKLIIEN